jgi:hypothetical protein
MSTRILPRHGLAAAILLAIAAPGIGLADDEPLYREFSSGAPSAAGDTYHNLSQEAAVEQSAQPAASMPVEVDSPVDLGHDDCECGAHHDCNCGGGLLSFLRPSDHCYDCFITPVTNPVYFEDPRTLTEVRWVFLHHKLPVALGAGDVQSVAMQARVALTDRLSVIAIKDGFIFAGPDAPHDDGWADPEAGLKYNLWADPKSQTLLTTGATFQIPVGTGRALQGNGSGVFNLFVTGGAQLGDRSHWVSASGFRLPTDRVDNSQIWYWSNHWDTMIWRKGLYAFTECNWYHYMSSGQGGVAGIGGLDVYNLGSTDVAGHSVVTMAAGLKVKPSRHTELGLAWEAPVTARHDLIDNRLTIDWIWRY